MILWLGLSPTEGVRDWSPLRSFPQPQPRGLPEAHVPSGLTHPAVTAGRQLAASVCLPSVTAG